jgi:hypothetical protein
MMTTLKPAAKKVNWFNAIEFLGGTMVDPPASCVGGSSFS